MNRHRRRTSAAAVTIAFGVALAGCAPAAENGATVSLPAVVPAPAAIDTGRGAPFALDERTRIAGADDAAVEALATLIRARTGLDVATTEPTAGKATTIELEVSPGGEAESYRLTADAAAIVITGADAAGLFYGIQTLGQLIARDGDSWTVPAVTIEDAPRFAYRGVMLDVARHFQPVETVNAYIDRAAGLKYNHLHLHLTDDQGWRLHFDSRPKLTELASGTSVGGDPGGFYSKADYQDIVEYAASRHMTVVPEIDMPSHTHAVSLAYPEITEAPVVNDPMLDQAKGEGIAAPVAGAPYEGTIVGFSSLKIHGEATYDFLADIFGELAAMTPGPYLHLGGDEALGTEPDDFALFIARASGIIADLGKTPVAWHEAGEAQGIADTTVGQYWGFVRPTNGADERARAFVDNGSQLILSPSDAIYLDMKYSADAPLGLTWANGPTSVERAYSWEPSEIVPGIDDGDILGIEAPLWTETLRTLDDIDEMAFPRIAAAAEAAWSPATGSSDLRTWASFRERVGTLAPLWSSLGIGFHPSDEIPWVSSDPASE
jgi:N-acetyl-beta-hexosaminidase